MSPVTRRSAAAPLIRQLRPVAALAAVLAVLVLSGCGHSGSKSPPTASTRTTPAAAEGMKPPLAGLLDRGSQRSYVDATAFPTVDTAPVAARASAFTGIVVNETWAQLEPTPGHEDWAPLDASLAAVTAYNHAHQADPLAVKLRIFGSYTAPAWAKALGGAPIQVEERKNGPADTLGRWWSADYRAAWSSFQHALAARYDTNALVRAVAVTSCMTNTGEPVNTILASDVLPTMLADGWTSAAQQQCLHGAFADYSGWRRTPVDFAFNPYRTVVAGRPTPDPAVTTQLMRDCANSAEQGGPHCVLGNHALQDSSATTSPQAPVYAEINTLWQQAHGGVQAYFQTAAHNGGGDCASIALAIAHHANSVELWTPSAHNPSYSAVPLATLQSWNKALLDGVAPSCH